MRNRLRLASFGVLVAAFFAGAPGSLSPAAVAEPSLAEGYRLYIEGEHRKAVAFYEKALKSSSRPLEIWLSGGVVLGELGDWNKAAEWLRRAAELAPQDADILTALGEAHLHRGDLASARGELGQALATDPNHPYALIAKGRLELADGNPAEGLELLERAASRNPDLTIAHYWLAKAKDDAKDPSGALEAFKKAAFGDSYFTQARHRLALALAKAGQLQDAWEQSLKLFRMDPEHKPYRRLEAELRALAGKAAAPDEEAPLSKTGPAGQTAGQGGPFLRVGIGTTMLGTPIGRRGVVFSCSTPFEIMETETNEVLARGKANEKWQADVVQLEDSRVIQLTSPNRKTTVSTDMAAVIRPETKKGAVITFRELSLDPAVAPPERKLRGKLEISRLADRMAVKVVNIVDLESYTHGVLASEMPIDSPLEALRAQAVVARTHALYILKVSRRHLKQGYDVCDGQHCQVYGGVGLESEKSRSIVDSTRGRVATYKGHVAHVLYASNCGGHTQSGLEVKGWGDVPYWKGALDADPAVTPAPYSPWKLRQWLRTTPKAYCGPSSFVHPSHFRWTRVVDAADLEEKLNQAFPVGELQSITGLKRSASGHLNSVLVRGSKGKRTIDGEFRIRQLLGVGSQRSALFVMETELDSKKRPLSFTFYGGGWGHGVGMCQSGAVGRAEAGQSYTDILQAYYRDIELGTLRY